MSAETNRNFIAAIERNWPDYVIAPGASRRSCCVDDPPNCAVCDGHGYDVDAEPHLASDCTACDGTGETPLDDISDEDMEVWGEPSFSHSECDSCGSTLGGDRYPAHAIMRDSFGKPEAPGQIWHIDICVDCLMFHANGELPDWESGS